MGNNRSTLVSGSTATTASLNSTSSLPVNTANINLHLTSGTQSSISFLKRFRNNPNHNHNFDELDGNITENNNVHKKKHPFKKKKQMYNNEDNNQNCNSRKKLEKNKRISLSASNIINNTNLKVTSSTTNESEYTSINENLGEASLTNRPKSNQESFYESTLDMEFANNNNNTQNNLKQIVDQVQTHYKNQNKENIEFQNSDKKSNSNSPSENVIDNNANLYSEIVNKNQTFKANLPPPVPPPLNNHKKNHLQPITNFFNKLTKTTRSQEQQQSPELITKKTESTIAVTPPPPTPAPMIPTKAFNPSKEFYTSLPAIQTFVEELYEEEEDDGGIYSKIDKSVHNDEKKPDGTPPNLPKTLVPTNLLNEEIETCLKMSSQNDNEYQSVQEFEYIKAEVSPRASPKPPLEYSPIEPLNINNQVYYSFTSDSQEKFELQNEYISRIDVKSNTDNKLFFKVDPSGVNKKSSFNSKGNKNLNLISETENSRNQSETSSHYHTVKL